MIDRKRKAREAKIFRAFNREADVGSFEALSEALAGEIPEFSISEAALIIDSSVFLRLGQYTDVIDYLKLRHAPPIVLPGQAVQEFWNNYLNAADSIATGIKRRFDELQKEIEKVDGSFGDFAERFAILTDEFRSSFGYVYDGSTVRRTMSLFEVLEDKAIVAHARREPFTSLANHRNMTKTPPGFKDAGDGDFFVWLDGLEGLLLAQQGGADFDHVVLVTNDRKPDWSRQGLAHPVLSAEMRSIVGASLSMWDIKKLVAKVGEVTD